MKKTQHAELEVRPKMSFASSQSYRKWIADDLYEREGKGQMNFAHRVCIPSPTRMRSPDRRITRGFQDQGHVLQVAEEGVLTDGELRG